MSYQLSYQRSTNQSAGKKILVKKIAFSSLKILLTLIPASLALSSCTSSDIKTAQAFSEASDGLQQLNTEVANDIYNSCARSSTWLARGTVGTQQNMRDALEMCDTDFRSNSVRTEIAGKLLVEYVGAIGSLATEDRETVRTRFEEIGIALQGLKIQSGDSTFQLQQNTIDTGVNIATFLTNLIQSDFRRRNLKTAIVCTDQSIQPYSADLSSFIDELYVKALLDDEIDSITRYFGGYRSPLTDTTNLLLDSGSPNSFTSLQETQIKRDNDLRDEIAKVIDRKNTAEAYVTLIRETATAHADLKHIFNDGKDELSPELAAKCNKYFAKDNSSKTSMKPLEADFPKQEITQSELERVREVAKAYTDKVTPLLERIKQKAE
jgi:hypothetical protein